MTNDLVRAIGAITPSSIDRPKRFAKQLHKAYPQKSLAQCQEAASHVYGYANWHALDKAIKQGVAAGPFNNSIDVDVLVRRAAAQASVLAFDMEDVDPAQSYERPQSVPFGSPMYDQWNEQRLEMAHKRCARVFSRALIFELEPTAECAPEPFVVVDSPFEPYSQQWMEQFPSLLVRWWRRNIGHQPAVASELEHADWNKDRPSSIVAFGRYWGVLCMYYAGTIDWCMCIGTAYLLASQYADSILQTTAIFHKEVRAISDGAQEWFSEEVESLRRYLVFEYLDGYMRDDIGKAPFANLQKEAEAVIKILDSRTSKRGVWRH